MPVEYDVVEERFPEEIEVAVYYVASEALTNAAKYAEASVVYGSRSRCSTALLVLEVADDGRGGAVAGGGPA